MIDPRDVLARIGTTTNRLIVLGNPNVTADAVAVLNEVERQLADFYDAETGTARPAPAVSRVAATVTASVHPDGTATASVLLPARDGVCELTLRAWADDDGGWEVEIPWPVDVDEDCAYHLHGGHLVAGGLVHVDA